MDSNFKRSPSKIWWGNEENWRSSSSSPGSQDSGFSDSHKSDNVTTKPSEKLLKDIFKEISTNKENFATGDEKTTPNKSNVWQKCMSEPIRKRYVKKSPKTSRRLFGLLDYAEDVADFESRHASPSESIASVRSLPATFDVKNNSELNRSAPPILCHSEDEGVTAFYSDSDDELKELFDDSPKHTSTPKNFGMARRKPIHLFLKQQRKLFSIEKETENKAVLTWACEIRRNSEPECTTLQSKSIAAELNEKVDFLANSMTKDLRSAMAHSASIESEYQNLNREQHHICALCQSLAGHIMNFFKTFNKSTHSSTSKLYDEIKSSAPEKALRLVSTLFDKWQLVRREVYSETLKTLVSKIEDPASEINLRASVTGAIYLATRNEHIAEMLIDNDLIPILLILCEKCEASTVRCLLLRALATLCYTNQSVRQFEKYSGIQVITDILEDSRPEPERSEAVTVLAQITAPWIEDNNNIRGLHDYSKRLVKALTRFLTNTKCCQNLLLCVAALSNISSIDTSSIKHMLHENTLGLLFEIIKKNCYNNVYLLEQVATLIANTSAIDTSYLIEIEAPKALVCFLKHNYREFEQVERRLQQKGIIALSRLSIDRKGADQIVENNGVDLLVKLCREKDERFESDAVLVAALATLRRVTDCCGKQVLSTQDSRELVEPKLLDSFLAYSNQNESYV